MITPPRLIDVGVAIEMRSRPAPRKNANVYWSTIDRPIVMIMSWTGPIPRLRSGFQMPASWA
jgi:hypothetical protein